MRFLILLMLSLGLTSEWGTSVSVRTPNDDTQPLDYELSIKLDDNEGKFRYNLKRDWERELGEKYIDDVFKFSHTINDFIYYGEFIISSINVKYSCNCKINFFISCKTHQNIFA